MTNNLFSSMRRTFAALLVCLLSLPCWNMADATSTHTPAAITAPPSGFNNSNSNFNFNFDKEIALTFVVLGAVVGAGIYLLVRKGPSIAGCATVDSSGLAIKDETSGGTYRLSGKTSAIQSGQRVRVYGKKRGKATPRDFLVKRSPKQLGACTIASGH